MFFKRKIISVDVMDFNAMNVSTGQIGSYIKKLYKKEGFKHIGYRTENRDGILRYVIYTLPNEKAIIKYFNDRCPAMVEEECRKLEVVEEFEWNKWQNGFEEIIG